MATYSGTTVKVNGAIANFRSTNGTLYTAPANGYAIVQVAVGDFVADTTVYFDVGNRPAGLIITKSAGTTVGGTNTTLTLYVGPSQELGVNGSGVWQANVSGVEFVNSP